MPILGVSNINLGDIWWKPGVSNTFYGNPMKIFGSPWNFVGLLRESGSSNENVGVFNKNLGSPTKSVKIWGLARKSGSLIQKSGSLTRKSVSLTQKSRSLEWNSGVSNLLRTLPLMWFHLILYWTRVLPRAASKCNFPSGNFPNLHFPMWHIPKG